LKEKSKARPTYQTAFLFYLTFTMKKETAICAIKGQLKQMA
jgi:hypothetical protein